jgi:hypothetical protein
MNRYFVQSTGFNIVQCAIEREIYCRVREVELYFRREGWSWCGAGAGVVLGARVGVDVDVGVGSGVEAGIWSWCWHEDKRS